MSIRTSLEQLIEIGNKRDEVHFNFIKQILLMASSLLGILVSLHKISNAQILHRTTFSVALGLLALGIIMLTVALSAQVSMQKEIFMKWKAEVTKQFKDESYKTKPIYGEPSKFYSFCEKIGYSSLLLSIIALTFYAILIS